MMATAQRATMMATARWAMAQQDTTTRTMATGNGATGDGLTGNEGDDDCYERRQRRLLENE
jgi:hypothetical protein